MQIKTNTENNSVTFNFESDEEVSRFIAMFLGSDFFYDASLANAMEKIAQNVKGAQSKIADFAIGDSVVLAPNFNSAAIGTVVGVSLDKNRLVVEWNNGKIATHLTEVSDVSILRKE